MSDDKPFFYAARNPRYGELYEGRWAVFLRRKGKASRQAYMSFRTRWTAENRAEYMNAEMQRTDGKDEPMNTKWTAERSWIRDHRCVGIFRIGTLAKPRDIATAAAAPRLLATLTELVANCENRWPSEPELAEARRLIASIEGDAS